MQSGHVIRRLLLLIPQLLLLTIITFVVIRLAPGDPIANRINATTGASLTEAQVTSLRAYFHLDEPLIVQYWLWLQRLLSADFGTSFVSGQPVLSIIAERLPYTLLLMGVGSAISLLAIPLGVLAGYRRGTFWDPLVSSFGVVGISIPQFWLAILAILVFAVWLGVLPAGGSRAAGGSVSPGELARHLILPAVVIGVEQMATLVRFVRASVANVLTEDYVRTARAKGVSEISVLGHHVLKNALLPTITIFGLRLPYLVAGAVLVETVFGWPGMGMLTVDASLSRDYPLVMALVFVVGVLTTLGSLLADILYGLVDPRVSAAA